MNTLLYLYGHSPVDDVINEYRRTRLHPIRSLFERIVRWFRDGNRG